MPKGIQYLRGTFEIKGITGDKTFAQKFPRQRAIHTHAHAPNKRYESRTIGPSKDYNLHMYLNNRILLAKIELMRGGHSFLSEEEESE